MCSHRINYLLIETQRSYAYFQLYKNMSWRKILVDVGGGEDCEHVLR